MIWPFFSRKVQQGEVVVEPRRMSVRGLIPWLLAAAFAVGAAWATQTNYLGTVFIADNDTPANQLSINSDGSLNTAGKELATSGSATSAAVLSNFPVDARGYGTFTLTFQSIGSGNTVVVEESDDQTTWYTNVINFANVTGGEFPSLSVAPSTTWLFYGRVHARYLRLRASVYGSGTVTATLTLKAAPVTSSFTVVTGNTASGGTDTGNGVKVAAIHNTNAPTVTNGQRVDLQGDTRGYLRTISDQCTLRAQATVTAGSTTQLIALSGSTVIRVCVLSVDMATAGTTSIVEGTGANCGTGTTTIIPPTSVGTTTPWVIGNGEAPVIRSTAGNAICVTAATGNAQVYMLYAQY